ncbi:hypothetical protein EDD22DRAFT_929982 [Suillus occidentalis]|nr:hypothetical protein EDD22DRAFT_929982 [Suillus occidentalis]
MLRRASVFVGVQASLIHFLEQSSNTISTVTLSTKPSITQILPILCVTLDFLSQASRVVVAFTTALFIFASLICGLRAPYSASFLTPQSTPHIRSFPVEQSRSTPSRTILLLPNYQRPLDRCRVVEMIEKKK